MADKGYIAQQVNALPSDWRTPIRNAFWYLMDNFKIGTGTRAINAQWYRLSSTSHITANMEFSVKHGLGMVPSQCWQVLDLSVVNSQVIPLQVSRAADAERIYLKSASTNAVFTLLVE